MFRRRRNFIQFQPNEPTIVVEEIPLIVAEEIKEPPPFEPTEPVMMDDIDYNLYEEKFETASVISSITDITVSNNSSNKNMPKKVILNFENSEIQEYILPIENQKEKKKYKPKIKENK